MGGGLDNGGGGMHLACAGIPWPYVSDQFSAIAVQSRLCLCVPVGPGWSGNKLQLNTIQYNTLHTIRKLLFARTARKHKFKARGEGSGGIGGVKGKCNDTKLRGRAPCPTPPQCAPHGHTEGGAEGGPGLVERGHRSPGPGPWVLAGWTLKGLEMGAWHALTAPLNTKSGLVAGYGCVVMGQWETEARGLLLVRT